MLILWEKLRLTTMLPPLPLPPSRPYCALTYGASDVYAPYFPGTGQLAEWKKLNLLPGCSPPFYHAPAPPRLLTPGSLRCCWCLRRGFHQRPKTFSNFLTVPGGKLGDFRPPYRPSSKFMIGGGRGAKREKVVGKLFSSSWHGTISCTTRALQSGKIRPARVLPPF